MLVNLILRCIKPPIHNVTRIRWIYYEKNIFIETSLVNGSDFLCQLFVFVFISANRGESVFRI